MSSSIASPTAGRPSGTRGDETMASGKTLTFCIMDPPYESSNTATVFRMIESAIKKGHNVNVFAYEGAVMLPFSKQAQHPNAVHGRSLEEENHPTTKDWVAALI